MSGGSLTITSDSLGVTKTSRSLSFITMNFEAGWPFDVAEVIEEELTSPGVNGRRWRAIFHQPRPFLVETVKDAATYAGAIDIARDYIRAKGSVCSLATSVAGVELSGLLVHVLDVSPFVSAALTTGSDATPNARAVARCKWSLVAVKVKLD